MCKDLRTVVWSINAREIPPENLDCGVLGYCGFYTTKSIVLEANRHASLDTLKTKGL